MAMRLLLNTAPDSLTSGCGVDGYDALAEAGSAYVEHGDENEGHGDAFSHVYLLMVFIASLWFAGKLALKLQMPALVGEIVFGIILGPHLLNLPGEQGSEILVVIGEIGLIMLVVEAGVDVDVGLLKVIGAPALGVAVLGSIFPISIGFCISYLCFGLDIGVSIAAGACFGPTSMGIALNVLKGAKLLNTPTGQLIIAAAILDDVIALIILSLLGAMKNPTALAIASPLIVSPVLILIFGYLAIRWIPRWISALMRFVPKAQQENAILGLLFIATFIMIPVCHFLGSSHLLGAFLAGLMFCTDHTIHHAWSKQIKRVLQWMLRIFFAATIGFAIPIREFTSPTVIIRGLVYCFAMLGKIFQGFWVRPLSKREFFIVGWSMSAWGEFAFILATASFSEGTLDQTTFSSVLLAVLLSVIISPYALSFSIKYFEKRQRSQMKQEMEKYAGTDLHPVYFAINTKSRGSWGHQQKILEKLFVLNLEIIDFRSWHASEFNHSHHQPLTKDSFFVMDRLLALPPTKHLQGVDKDELVARVKLLRVSLKNVLGDAAVISTKRWLPGVAKKDDQLEPTDDYVKAMFGGDIAYQPKNRKSIEYCRNEAFKQAHSMMSLSERRATIDEVRRQSSHRLMAKRMLRGGAASDVSADERDHDRDFSFSEQAGNMTKSQSSPAKGGKHRRHPKMDGGAPFGQGHTGETGARGAGALPVTDGTIDITNWAVSADDGDDETGGANREDSHVSCIYGDEDAQHQQLKENSVEHVPDYVLEMFNPAETSPAIGVDREEDTMVVEPLHDPATVEMYQPPPSAYPAIQQQQQPVSPRSKMTIRINPPGPRPTMSAVASQSPVGTDVGYDIMNSPVASDAGYD